MNGRTTPSQAVRSKSALAWAVRDVWAWPVATLRSMIEMARPRHCAK
jgi:hypothetical protein